MAKNENENRPNGESEAVHDAYSKLGHMGGEKGGEIRKEQMARGDIFTKENPQNPDEPPSGTQQRNERRNER